MSRPAGGCLLALVLLSAAEAHAGETGDSNREGFTFELGIGGGLLEASGLARDGGTLVDFGLEPHCLSFGGFLTPRFALLYRWSSTYYGAENAAGETAQGTLGTQGVQLQYWATDRWTISSGLGVAYFGNFLFRDDADPAIKLGPGFTWRTGYRFVRFGPLDNHSFSLSIKVVGGFFPGRVAAGQTLNVEYQWY